jgi:hypothetical protein
MRGSTPRRSRAPGFSLIEIVIVLFLTGLMLYCVANLTDRTFQTMNFLQEKSTTLESASLACERLSTEMKEMISVPVVSPPVSFTKVIPSVPRYVGNDPAANPDDWLRSYPSGQTATIKYSMVGDKILRQVNSEPTLEVAVNVNAFDVSTINRDGDYLIKLSILELRRVVSFETIVICPGVPRS